MESTTTLRRAWRRGAWSRSWACLLSLGRGQAGVSAVELAMIAPVLALLIVGTVDYGLVWTRNTQITNAVRAGTQYAMIRRPIQGDTTAIRQQVIDAAPAPKIGSHDPQVTLFCECPGGTAAAGCDPAVCAPADMETFISITLSEQYPLLLDYPGFNNPVTLTQSSIMRLN
jgi:Flp pilus assembly pilin Flp